VQEPRLARVRRHGARAERATKSARALLFAFLLEEILKRVSCFVPATRKHPRASAPRRA
jgi:hypothetical protein